jgi:hypothetical protein
VRRRPVVGRIHGKTGQSTGAGGKPYGVRTKPLARAGGREVVKVTLPCSGFAPSAVRILRGSRTAVLGSDGVKERQARQISSQAVRDLLPGRPAEAF